MMDEILKKESEFKVYEEAFLGIPLWRLFRFRVRIKHKKEKYGVSHNSRKRKPINIYLVYNFLLSLFGFHKLFKIKRDRIDNVFFAFPRLQKYDGYYYDKFTDPIIENSGIAKESIVFQKALVGIKLINRYKATDNFFRTDALDMMAHVFSVLLFPFIFVFNYKEISSLFGKIKDYYNLSSKNLVFFVLKMGNFLFLYQLYKLIIGFISPKKVYVVDREVFFPVILACKTLGVTVYELQHGATHGETPLYSGPYDKRIDPDYFLVFGAAWFGTQFAIPTSKIFNIGWAYMDFMNKRVKQQVKKKSSVLVISAPGRTSDILEAAISLSKLHENIIFDVRLHPQESYTDFQLRMISQSKNTFLTDNKIDSYLALIPYKYVIGENSTVLYEALAMGKLVGRLEFNNFHPDKLAGIKTDGFFYILNESAFAEFLVQDPGKKLDIVSGYYSVYNPDILIDLP